jgi:hypothetical protein
MSRRPERKPLWHLLFIPLIGGAIIGYALFWASRVNLSMDPTRAERKDIRAATTCEQLNRLYELYSGDSYGSPNDAAGKTVEKMQQLHCELPESAD